MQSEESIRRSAINQKRSLGRSAMQLEESTWRSAINQKKSIGRNAIN
jgi:hypothetical protein